MLTLVEHWVEEAQVSSKFMTSEPSELLRSDLGIVFTLEKLFTKNLWLSECLVEVL